MPRLHSIVAILAVLFLSTLTTVLADNSPGCGKTPTLTSGAKTITVNGKSRRYFLRIPDGYDKSKPYRLIFGLHWRDADYTGVDGGTAPYYGLKKLAANSAIFIAPDGLNKGWGNTGGEDVTLVTEIMKLVEDDLCVNQKLRFSLGFSYGGAMSYALACARPDDFRAIAVLSGAQLSGCAGGKTPVAYYGQHGVRDGVLNIGMGRSLRDNFLKNNGCTAQTASEPASGSKKHQKTVYAGCSTDHPVVWVAFDGDHMALPGDTGTDVGTSSWTIEEVWNFFTQFK